MVTALTMNEMGVVWLICSTFHLKMDIYTCYDGHAFIDCFYAHGPLRTRLNVLDITVVTVVSAMFGCPGRPRIAICGGRISVVLAAAAAASRSGCRESGSGFRQRSAS